MKRLVPFVVVLSSAAVAVALLFLRLGQEHEPETTAPSTIFPVVEEETSAPAGTTEAPSDAAQDDAVAGPRAAERDVVPARERVSGEHDAARARLVVRSSAGGRESGAEPPSSSEQTANRTEIGKAVSEAIRGAFPRLRDCYDQGLRQNAELSGRVTLLLAIEKREGVGRVIDAEPEESDTTLDSVLVQACLLDALSGVDFPVPPAGESYTIRYPLNFRPAE